eukprot:TRINITY_DN24415_c0_g1_i1.p1 TRINITY_DN24415_c0_g1~~TRINITY_DN24415_c0_g1_i1.p1  ORF type:complete len:361 (-),score=73.45 TRINITY_DN24415_c0_g1_i1:308-1390(-)
MRHGPFDEIGTRSPTFLTSKDFSLIAEVKKSRGARFFARKFQNLTEPETLSFRKRLDAAVTRKELSEITVEGSDWPVLVKWMQAGHLSKWSKDPEEAEGEGLAGHSSSINGAQDDGISTDDADNLTVQIAKLSLLDNDNDYKILGAVELRYAPEVWLLKRGSDRWKLVERFAIPPQPNPKHGGSGFGLSLMAVRVGTGWSKVKERFDGFVNVIPVAQLRAMTLVTYWARHTLNAVELEKTNLEVRAEWIPPNSSSVCGRTLQDLEHNHLFGPPLVLRFSKKCVETPGIWTVRIALLHKGEDSVIALGFREFVAASTMEDLTLSEMRRFFDLLPSSGGGVGQAQAHEGSCSKDGGNLTCST